jgi:hypothetical protein
MNLKLISVRQFEPSPEDSPNAKWQEKGGQTEQVEKEK